MSPTPNRDDRKLAELILYVAQQSLDDPFFGAVKLNKILFQAESQAYLRLGRTLTDQPYFRLENGPAPQHLRPIRDELMAAGRAGLVSQDIGPAYRPQERLVALDQPQMNLFTADERELIDATIAELRPFTGTTLSARTHRLPAWRAAKDKEVIPFETAFLSETVTQVDLDRALDLALEHDWA
jgi:hypothetical protein